MAHCKICDIEFVPRHHTAVTCSTDCAEINHKKIKKAHYERNKPKMLDRSRRSHLLRNYGITSEDYSAMFDSQNGVCKICNNPETEIEHKTGNIKGLAVDHCHDTGLVRGLLCSKCNTALGKFKSIEILESALTYLKEKSHGSQE